MSKDNVTIGDIIDGKAKMIPCLKHKKAGLFAQICCPDCMDEWVEK